MRGKASGVVTARLDTFGVIFHSIFPYYIIQPTASSFFIPPRIEYLLCFCLLGGNKQKKQSKYSRGGSHGKA